MNISPIIWEAVFGYRDRDYLALRRYPVIGWDDEGVPYLCDTYTGRLWPVLDYVDNTTLLIGVYPPGVQFSMKSAGEVVEELFPNKSDGDVTIIETSE